MKKFISTVIVAGLTLSPAMAQQANYTSVGQLTQAAQQAAGGQLAMIHGGFIGGATASTAQPTGVVQPIGVVPPIGPMARPLSGGNVNTPGMNAGPMADDTSTLIAAGIGAAVLIIPIAISLLGDDN